MHCGAAVLECQAMTPFAEIFALAAARKGGVLALEQILSTTTPRPPAEIALLPDDQILAEMTRRIFYAGFSSKVIDDKWPAFREGFRRIRPERLRLHVGGAF